MQHCRLLLIGRAASLDFDDNACINIVVTRGTYYTLHNQAHKRLDMKLIGRPQSFNSTRFRVSDYHKIALGLESNTRVFLAASPPRRSSQVTEVILSTLHPNDWRYLYRLTALLTEGQGVVATVLALLSQEAVNINILETLTTENTKSHELLAFLTLSGNPQRAAQLRNKWSAHLRKLGILKHDDDLELLPLRRLREVAHTRAIRKTSTWIEASILDGVIHLTKDDWRRLFQLPDGAATLSDYSQVVMFSDTEEKYMSLYFPPRTECLLRIAVRHAEQIGALAAFTAKLKPAHVNIVNCYSRLQKSGQSAEWRATLDVTNSQSCFRFLQEIQTCTPFFEEFLRLSVHYTPTNVRRNFLTNMYSYESGIRSITMFHGRDDLIREVTQEKRHFLISGYYKTGKTSFLFKLANEFASSTKIIPVLVHLKGTGVTTFFNKLLHSIWNSLLEMDSTLVAPASLRPFLPHDQIAAIPAQFDRPGVLHSIKAHQPSFSAKDKIERAIKDLIVAARMFNKTGFALLLDEAQDILYSTRKDGVDELRDILVYLSERIEDLRWVLADSKHWNTAEGGVSNLTSKLKVIVLGCLDDTAAEQLITEPLRALALYPATPQVIQRLLRLSGRQPCYIQALCGRLIEHFETAPSVVDIITDDLIDDVVRDTVGDLHVHFEQMRTDLMGVLNPRVIEEMLGSDRAVVVTRRRLVTHETTESASQSSLSLDAVPGLQRQDVKHTFKRRTRRGGSRPAAHESITVDISSSGAKDEDTYALTDLFREWYFRHSASNLASDRATTGDRFE